MLVAFASHVNPDGANDGAGNRVATEANGVNSTANNDENAATGL
jgi:hypothetical protein